MSELYGREYTLNVGGILIATRTLDQMEQEALRITFKITKTLKKEPNKAEINVYNLSPQTREYFSTQRNALVELLAGYAGQTPRIFLGNLHYANSSKQGVDWITTFQSADGGKRQKQARAKISLKGPVNVRQVLKELAKSLETDIGNVFDKLEAGSPREALKQVFNNGYVFGGRAEKALSNIMQKYGLDVSIQDNALQAIGPSEILVRGPVPVLRAESEGQANTGLVGSPEVGEKGSVRVRSLIQPLLIPGAGVDIISKEVEGRFRIDKVDYIGDSRGDDWFADLECSQV